MPKLKRKSQEQKAKETKNRMKTLRQDDNFRINSNVKNSVCQGKRLENEQNLKDHRLKLITNQSKRLKKTTLLKIHRKRLSQCQSARLINQEALQVHKNRLKQCQISRLSNQQALQVHKNRLKQCQISRLSNQQALQVHKNRLKQCQISRLSNVQSLLMHKRRLIDNQIIRLAVKKNLIKHNQLSKNIQKIRLSILRNRIKHNERQKLCQKNRLSNIVNRTNHRKLQKMCQKNRLSNVVNAIKHREALKLCQKNRLSKIANRVKHRETLKLCQKNRLSKIANRVKHRETLKLCQKNRLSNTVNRTKHRERQIMCQKNRLRIKKLQALHNYRKRIAQKKRLSDITERQIYNQRSSESYYRCCYKKNKSVFDKAKKKYLREIKKGPTCKCASCGRLWFRSSVSHYTLNNLVDKGVTEEFVISTCPEKEGDKVIGFLCSTCKCHILKSKVPKLSLFYKELQFPKIPEELKDLTALEERFISPRVPFMKIQTLSYAGQFAMHGKVVNVPTDVNKSVFILPRLHHETDVIPVALKKKKSFKSNYLFSSVRPKVILKAVNSLEHSEVYQKCKIIIDENRFFQAHAQHFVTKSPLNQASIVTNEINSNIRDDAEYDSDFDKDEPEPDNVPSEETLLQPSVLVFAPGEDNIPLSILMDTDAESMSFIKIYGGTIRQIPKHLSYQDWVKSEVTRSDRRCANVPKLFFSSSKLRIQKITGSVCFCLRQIKGKPNVTAGMLLDSNCVKNLITHDSGFKVFSSDRGSPAFWEAKKKEVFAMLRQLGPPTFFLTLSAAETKWLELLVLLKNVVDNETVSEEDAMNFTFQEKCRLIQSDPVTCSRYFEYRTRKLFAVIKAKNAMFENHKVIDYYIRVEFQQRGSPHLHCLLWLEDTPKLIEKNNESKNDCCLIIDKFISCSSNELDKDLISFQTHKHSSSCKKKTKAGVKCRYGIPFFPMPETVILDPFETEITDELTKKSKANLKAIKVLLEDMFKEKVQFETFPEFLIKLNLNFNDYITAIRSGLKRTTVFLKRQPSDIKINAYQKDILNLHRANMDIQFITDMYSCVHYILNYINKSNRGVSKALYEAMEEIKTGNYDLKNKLKVLANKFINASEFSAQEAVYFVLGMPLSKSSRNTVFINTNVPEKRVTVVKSKRELLQLDEDSTNVTNTNILDQYVCRPDILENECLADFAANYNFSKIRRLTNKSGKIPEPVEEEEISNDEDDESNNWTGNEFKLNNNMGYIYKKKRPKVIRFVNFQKEKNSHDYYREQLMLFLPWKNELSDLLRPDVEKLYLENLEELNNNKKKYMYNEENYAEIEDILQHVNTICSDVSDIEDDNDNGFSILNDRTNEGDIFPTNEGEVNNKKDNDYFPIPKLIPNTDYTQLMRSLNEKQRKYLLHILHLIKNHVQSTFDCVLGGAGVGKSVLIKAIHQTVLRFYMSTPGTNIDQLSVLLCAPTGKAAFGISGITLHSAFALPLNQSHGEMIPLSHSVRNTLYSKLKDIKLIIIDEVSMVGCRMLNQVDLRLREIFKEDIPFANKNIVLFGDFNQLPPVGDRFVFQCDLSNPYGLIAGNPLWELFKGYQLTEIMRQKDDATFANMLNRLAVGKLTEEDIAMFKTRETDATYPENTVHLYRSNDEVNQFNLKAISTQPYVTEVKAIDTISGEKLSDISKQSLLTSVYNMKLQDTQGLPSSIQLSANIKYMLTCNVDVSDGLFNGAVGVLKFIEVNSKNEVVRLWFDFFEKLIGQKSRMENRNIAKSLNIIDIWTPIIKSTKMIKPRKNSAALVARKQFPITPAESITIYKSQGGTFANVKVNVKRNLRRNELYVACSRAISLSGLYLEGQFKPPVPPSSHDPVPYAVRSLLNDNPIRFSIKFLQESLYTFSFVFHNTQSLNAHLPDIKADQSFLAADVLLLVETWSKESDNYNIPGFLEIARMYSESSKRQPFGLSVFCKNHLSLDHEFITYHCDTTMKKSVNMVSFHIKSYCFCVVYKPPNTPYSAIKTDFLLMLKKAKESGKEVILVGDFNIDLKIHKTHSMVLDIMKYGLELAVPTDQSSTNQNTQIDLCFSNCKQLSASYYESYYSYHKPIVGVIDRKNTDKEDLADSQTQMPKTILPTNVTKETDICTSIKKEIKDKNEITEPKKLPPLTTKKTELDDICNSVQTHTTTVKLPPGFVNEDQVSCYCNAVLQGILHQSNILNDILVEECSSPLGEIAQNYRLGKSVLNSFLIRKFVDEKNNENVYSHRQQQDAAEFLNHLIDVSNSLKNNVMHVLITKQKCMECGFINTQSLPNKILLLEMTGEAQNLTLSQMINEEVNVWKPRGSWRCPSCNNMCCKEEIVTISLPNQFLIVQLGLWQVVGNNIVKRNNISIKNVPKDRIKICENNYKVNAAIFHHGISVQSGHYTTVLRKENSWFRANDKSVTNCNWPRCAKDVYMFICSCLNPAEE